MFSKFKEAIGKVTDDDKEHQSKKPIVDISFIGAKEI